MRQLLLVLLAGCASALPDEVHGTVHGGEYDYMGAGDSFPTAEPLRDKTGESLGVSITAVYRLKPQRVVIEGFNRDDPPPYWLAAALQGKPIPSDPPEKKGAINPEEWIPEIDKSGEGTKWLIALAIIVAGFLAYLKWVKLPKGPKTK